MEEARQSAVVERLKAREAQRTAEAAKRHEELHADNLETESAPAFLEEFHRHQATLDAAIEAYAALASGDQTSPSTKLEDLALGTATLERSLASAAYFLPQYDLRNASLAVAALKQRLDAATQAQQPRKKFSFSRKPAASALKEANFPTQQGNIAPASRAPTTATNNHSNNLPAPTGGPSSSTVAIPTGRTIAGLRDQTIVLTTADTKESEDVTLSDLQGCCVHLLTPLGALFAHNLIDCTVVAGPVAGAMHIENLKGCKVYAASRQVRIHSAHNCDFYLRVRSGPIIEHSASIRFAPLASLSYPEAADELKVQGLEEENGKWADVQDFGWLRAAASPHWQILPEGDRQPTPLGN